MREITSHKLNGLNDSLTIKVLDEPGAGGANHDYAITFYDATYKGERSPISERHHRNCIISFQNGPIAEAGVNGISQEALLAICIDRLECFQAGPYACDDNANALHDLKNALGWLQNRTRQRLARGVEGTSKV